MDSKLRAAFEAWIAQPPYERGTQRFGGYSAWAGHYQDYAVQLAWEAWQAALAVHDARGEAVAWLAADGTGRVIDAKAKDAGSRAAATGSATAIYSIPLYTAPPAPQVDEAMVERASEASWPIAKSSMESADWNEIGRPRREHHKRVVRAALTAALEVPNA